MALNGLFCADVLLRTYSVFRKPPNMVCDARQTPHPSPLQPGGKPSVATNLNLAYSQVCARANNCSSLDVPLRSIRLVCCKTCYPS